MKITFFLFFFSFQTCLETTLASKQPAILIQCSELWDYRRILPIFYAIDVQHPLWEGSRQQGLFVRGLAAQQLANALSCNEYQGPATSNNKNTFSLSSRGQKQKIKELHSLEPLGESPFASSSFLWLLAFLDLPWLVAQSLQIAFLSL